MTREDTFAALASVASTDLQRVRVFGEHVTVPCNKNRSLLLSGGTVEELACRS